MGRAESRPRERQSRRLSFGLRRVAGASYLTFLSRLPRAVARLALALPLLAVLLPSGEVQAQTLPVVQFTGTSTVSYDEGEFSTSTQSAFIALSGTSQSSTSVDFSFTSSGTNPANGCPGGTGLAACFGAGYDYYVTGLSSASVVDSGTLTFAAGVAFKALNIVLIGDDAVEGDETFTITLSNPSGLTLGTNSVLTVTIVDNDEAAAAALQSVAVTSTGPYALNETIVVTATFDQAVTVTGTPRIPLSISGVTKYATYQSGSATTALVFSYTPVAGDNDTDGVTIAASSLQLNGGTIRVGTTDAVLTHPETAAAAINAVDTVAPVLQGNPASNEDGTQIILTYNETLQTSVDVADFRVRFSGVSRGFPAAAAVDGMTVVLTLKSNQVMQADDEEVELEFTGALKDVAGNVVPGFNFRTVDNNVLVPVPAAPTNLRTTAVRALEVQLAWDAVAGADSYQYSYEELSGSFFESGWIDQVGTGLSTQVRGLKPGSPYLFYVRAVNSAGVSLSDEVSLTTGTLSWTVAPDATDYTEGDAIAVTVSAVTSYGGDCPASVPPEPGADGLRPGRGAVRRRHQDADLRGLRVEQDGELRDRRRQRGRGRRRGDLHAGSSTTDDSTPHLCRHLGRVRPSAAVTVADNDEPATLPVVQFTSQPVCTRTTNRLYSTEFASLVLTITGNVQHLATVTVAVHDFPGRQQQSRHACVPRASGVDLSAPTAGYDFYHAVGATTVYSGTLFFAPGDHGPMNISVYLAPRHHRGGRRDVHGDAVEPERHATLGTRIRSATVTIVDDDEPPAAPALQTVRYHLRHRPLCAERADRGDGDVQRGGDGEHDGRHPAHPARHRRRDQIRGLPERLGHGTALIFSYTPVAGDATTPTG